jgi:hypothetical protein
MECLGLHNKPKAEVHPGHMLTGTEEEEGVITTKDLFKHLDSLRSCFLNPLKTKRVCFI